MMTLPLAPFAVLPPDPVRAFRVAYVVGLGPTVPLYCIAPIVDPGRFPPTRYWRRREAYWTRKYNRVSR